MAQCERGSPQNSLVHLTQLLWQQAENLSGTSLGFGLDYSSFCKELQMTSTVKYGPFSTLNFVSVSSL